MNDFDLYLDHLRGNLLYLRAGYLLRNGNAEKPLKALFAAYLERCESWSYIMDKRFGGQEVDFIALQAGIPQYTVEFKCTFARDPGLTKLSAVKALEQAGRNRAIGRLEPKLKGLPAYIVHFLNHSNPAEDALAYPDWLRQRFPATSRPTTTERLMEIYRKTAKVKGMRISAKAVPVLSPEHQLNGCQLDSVMVKLG